MAVADPAMTRITVSALFMLTILFAASPVMAGELVRASGFKPIQTAASPLPGDAALLGAADDQQNAALPPPCTGRDRTGAKAGTYAGAAAGIIGGLAIRNGGNALDKLAAAVIGMAVGGTAGYVGGRAHDGAYDGGLECEDPSRAYSRYQSPVMLPNTELRLDQQQRVLIIHPVVDKN